MDIIDLVAQLRPLVAEAAAIVVAAIAALAMARFRAWTGMEIEARHRDALQSALANAARLVVAGRPAAGDRAADLFVGVDYVQRSVPDALRHFGVEDDARILDLIEPHVARLRTAA